MTLGLIRVIVKDPAVVQLGVMAVEHLMHILPVEEVTEHHIEHTALIITPQLQMLLVDRDSTTS